jgi:hypothetical protein
MIQLSIFLTIIVICIEAGVDPVATNVDPKHELLTEIAGRYNMFYDYLDNKGMI